MSKKMKVTILKPAGNDTALVEGIPAKKDRKKINGQIMKLFSNLEQVGFYDINGTPRLEMAGGEFCGNATRSFAFLLFKGKKGKGYFRVSGTKQLLEAGIKNFQSSFAQMPIYKSFSRVRQLDKNIWQVELKGITHLITPLLSINKENLKVEGKKLLKKYNLLQTVPASGVMFYTKFKDGSYKLDPIVWVRDIKTLFYETACASGSAGLGLWWIKENELNKAELKIQQPSKKNITVRVFKDKSKFKEAYIEGPLEVLFTGEINL